jgi:glycosyltransferase involved in cell wall biosynthesis
LTVVIDDGSFDGTASVLSLPNTAIIRNPFNMGKGASIQIGFNACRKVCPDMVVTLDGDGQHNPDDIPSLISPITDNKADITIGSRYRNLKDIPRFRRMAILILNYVCGLFITEVQDNLSGFRCFSKNALEMFYNINSRGYGVEIEQLFIARKHTMRVEEIPVNIYYRNLHKNSRAKSFRQLVEITGMIIKLTMMLRTKSN